MQNYILGLTDYANNLQKVYQTLLNQHKNHNDFFLDLRQFPLEGTQVIDRYHYQIWLKGKYPQFMFWLAMPFFAPVPWEADYFYSQPGMYKKDIAWDWNPVGTGPYMLTENNPNRRMVLARNPNFHGEKYPTEGLAKDYSAGLMVKAGQPMPFIDKVIYSLEKESIPRWNKFLQGYYDLSNIASDSFDQAIHLDENGNASLTPTLKAKNIILQTIVEPAIYYYGFNMLDPIVGGYSNTQKKLRQAIAIALDRQEYIAIFLNGRGSIAQGPIPPGIFGYVSGKEGVNPYLYDWENNRLQTKSINYAKKLLAQAGYPNGIDPKTKQALVLNYDVVTSGGPDDQATLNWMRKQFAKLGIQLNIRATLYNRFQEKVRTGNAQFFSWAWSADYPDPENFLFLLYGPNGKVRYGGENATNYVNPAYDALFEKMRGMENGSERQAIIQKMIAIVQADSPWVWGYYPKTFLLQQEWMGPIKLSGIANNELKYQWLDYKKRAEKIKQWNRPIAWPLLLIILIIIFLLTPVFINYWRREHRSLVKRF
jgi:ABC-type transport system substrate-binding protein